MRTLHIPTDRPTDGSDWRPGRTTRPPVIADPTAAERGLPVRYLLAVVVLTAVLTVAAMLVIAGRAGAASPEVCILTARTLPAAGCVIAPWPKYVWRHRRRHHYPRHL